MYNFRKFSDLGLKRAKHLVRQNLSQNKWRCMSQMEIPPEEKIVPQFSIPKGILGQPTYHTHPHMIAKGHLTCGITQMEYKERRDTLVNKLIAEVDNVHKSHIIIIPAARKQYMSDKIPYVFRQNSDFFYLTGCLEPSAILVMLKPSQTDNYKSILFVHEKDAHAELWEGPRSGCSVSAQLFSVDEARPVDSFNQYITKITSLSKPGILWYHNENPANLDIHDVIRSVLHGQISLEDPQKTLHQMRVIKSPAEIELMKEACYIGAQSVNMAMACTKPGVSERSVDAVLEYSCRQAGAEHAAFPPVVAGGARATHIHYVANNQLLHEQEMLLVDSGCQRWMYNSDISRTWPVSGKFSKYHRILYELVLTVQKRLIELVGEQRPALDQLFEQMCRLLGTQLQQEGILPKNIDSNDLIGRAYRLCPHHVSHYLGLDVHDAPLVRRRVPVATGMLVTVEPGTPLSTGQVST
ncbi:PREDICTED: probable Xaa-Pro aminopeptidase 3 isoform X2 [Papilio polytes]|uniref:probable Xaa-Pro aminopeptidase 3 isoform X2 n=1 Tax=Papilio polytes TaxID=76194 RepID=UPI0006761A47|nr:PREDICTED: probable Xaa-Pro aminopeptidase 3 isoform X2 [Papilio polytes]